MTQLERVLRALQRAGDHGITRVDFQSPTIDGDEPILNIPARIEELRLAGHQITSGERRSRCTVYRIAPVLLAAGRPAPPASSPDAGAESGGPAVSRTSLFDAEPVRPRNALYGDEAA